MTANPSASAQSTKLWRWYGQSRPPFADTPESGQESVWDYPRPPRIVLDAREVVVRAGSIEVARTRRAQRICETASPPTFYLPAEDVRREFLVSAQGSSHCEWKGRASYWSVIADDRRMEQVAWSYEVPLAAAAVIAGHLAFYPDRLECFVDGERVQPQRGRFYGGWITRELAGPFKGAPGTEGW